MAGCRTVKQEVCQTEISKERSLAFSKRLARTKGSAFIKAISAFALPRRASLLGVILALALVMVGCKSTESISKSESLITDKNELYERDSIVIRDSVIVRITDDTVYKDRWHTEYKDRIVQHVDTIVRVDERVVETVVEKKVVPKWALWVTGYCLLVTGIIILWIILKIKRIL